MNRPSKFVNRKYFQRLLIGFLIFILFLQIPFSFAVLGAAKKSVLNNINTSNQTVLEQLQSNYVSFSESISNLTSSIFWRDDIQKILYSPTPEFEDVHFATLNLHQTFFSSHPDLHSICLYNKYEQQLYVISATGTLEKTAFLDFVKDQEQITPLQPILHPSPLALVGRQPNPMIFTYFMYQFNDPSGSNESFLAVNQYADQSVSTIDTFSGTSDSVPTATYYVTDDAFIASKQLPEEVAEDHEDLIANFLLKKQTLPETGSSYEDKVGRTKYLITYIHTDHADSSLLIIQDYDDVFLEIHTLSTRFTVITLLFSVASIAFAFYATQQLYKPINNMYDFVSAKEVSTAPALPRRVNELDIIKHAYQTTSERNRSLEQIGSVYQPIALQYGISSLLLRNNAHGIEQFRKAHPNHWLSSHSDGTLQTVLLEPLPAQDSPGHLDDADTALYLYAIQNVTEELLDPSFDYACFRHAKNVLGILVRPKAAAGEALTDILEKTRMFMRENFTIEVAAAVSTEASALTGLPTTLQEACVCLSYVFLLGPTIITPQQITGNENNPQTLYPADLDARIEESIASQNTAECKTVLSEIKAILRQFHVKNAVMCTTSLLNLVQRLLNKYPASTNSAAFSLTTLYGYISESGTINQCFDAIFDYICLHTSGQKYESQTANELFLNTVYELVQNSYFDYNLSSQLIADHLGLSNRYLMKKFKSLTGLSLNEYITDLRMKMAAIFLRDTDDPVSTISEKIGIDNLSYFYRLFKKVYGCTPKAFRETQENAPQ